MSLFLHLIADFRDPVAMNTWDLDDAMKTAYFDLGLEPIFRFYIEDQKYGNVPAHLKIFPIYFYSCVEIDDHFKTYMRKLAMLFNSRDNGKYFASSVQKIFEKICKDAVLEDEIFIEETVTTPADLSKFIPNSIDWIGFLTQNYKISANTKIVVINLHKKMAKLKDLASLDPSAVRNFFALKLIEKYIAAMPKNIKDVYIEYQNKTGNVAYAFPVETDWRSCLKDNINEAMTLALLAEMEKYSEKPVIMNQRLEELGESIRHAGMNRMASLRFLDSKVKRIIWNRLNDKVMVLGGPKWLTCDEKLDRFYEHLNANRSDPYLVNLVNARSFTGKIKATKLNIKDPNIWLFFVRYADAVGAAAFSIPSANGLAIMNSMLGEPFYNDDWPMYLNYGGIGSLIGHEYGHDFDGEVYWMNASRLSTMDNMVKCLRDYYPKVDYKGFKLENSSSIARLTQIQVMSDVLGLKWSWEAYKKEVKRSQREELRLPGIDYTPDQLFFINLAQTWCFQDNVNRTNFKYGARSLIFFSQSEFMPKVFNCPAGSTMNPKQQCKIW
ncbi:endothelin-converting enzyme 2-like isoform X2 [Lineus longissimus]|uniref:endothelin-converting enzyme 2-like isoform X2 n=1 Tax=Lineus longissimus TaxID=88925 RepID=UPI00315D5022